MSLCHLEGEGYITPESLLQDENEGYLEKMGWLGRSRIPWGKYFGVVISRHLFTWTLQGFGLPPYIRWGFSLLSALTGLIASLDL
jgi:hypothetical protein